MVEDTDRVLHGFRPGCPGTAEVVAFSCAGGWGPPGLTGCPWLLGSGDRACRRVLLRSRLHALQTGRAKPGAASAHSGVQTQSFFPAPPTRFLPRWFREDPRKQGQS